ncbi:M15 family metallopeptidase [Sphingomonas echinoides]|uniref:M15 family metallopeptidase n=1 Tax=Sphingomonas echinoides TaxID=59803 RepID=A0ABU4PNJ7_9SPHN|nr:M15 family metallopeptidase [Sphingomonas echinoides]MDX5984698.1 M15 family metallopeptidase [Sphingomonas echinoides]
MGARVTKDLFLQIGGNVDGLSAASKAGRTALLNLGNTAENIAAEVEKAFADLGKTNIEANAKDIERTYQRTFAAIRQNAQQVLAAPDKGSAAQILNAAGSEAAAVAAEHQAAQLRQLAAAAAIVAQRAGELGAEERILAVGFETAAQQATRQAEALRAQAGVMSAVHAELGEAGVAQDEVEHGARRMGIAQMEMMHVVRASSDAFAAGAPIAQIFSMEIGRVAEAAAMSGDSLGRVGAFLAGPWGVALTVGIAVLGPLVGKLFETDDAAKKAMEGLRDFEQKELDLPSLIDKTTGKLKEQVDVLTNLARVAREVLPGRIADATSDAAKAQTAGFAAARAKLVAQGKSRAGPNDVDLSRAIFNSGGSLQKLDMNIQAILPTHPELAELARTIADYTGQEALAIQKTRDLKGQQDALNTALRGGVVATTELAQRQVEQAMAVTAVEKAQIALKSVQDRKASIDDMPFGPAQQKAVQKYKADLLSATRALKSAQQAAKNPQFGREVDVAQATAIVQGIGGRVTSGYRSHARQQQLYDDKVSGRHDGPVAVPGTSAHETGGAIDVAFGPGISIATIKKAFADAGVQLRKVLREDGQKVFHVEFGKKGPSQEVLDKRDEAAREKAANDDRAYQGQLGQAQERIKRDMAALADTIEQRAVNEGFGIENAKVQRNLEIEDQLQQKKIDKPRALILEGLNNSAAVLETEAVKKKLREAQDDRTLQIGRDDIRDKIALLQLQGNLATTSEDRKRIALQILDYEEREARATLANAISKETDPQRKAGLEVQLANLTPQYALQRQGAERQNADPLEAYKLHLQESVSGMNDALKAVQADGLRGLEDGLIGIISGTESVGSAFKKMANAIIADLARIAVEQLIFKVLGLSLPGHATGHVPGYATGLVPGFATGMVDSDGVIHGPGTGTSDSILALLGNAPIRIANEESIMTAHATKRYGPVLKAMNENTLPGFATGRIPDSAIFYPRLPDAQKLRPAAPATPIVYDLRGAVLTQDLLQQMNEISARHAMVSIVAGSNMAMQELSERQAQAIPA